MPPNQKSGGQLEIDRRLRRLLAALAQPGATPGRCDLREGFVVVAATRNGLTSVCANAPLAVAEELVLVGWALWTKTNRLELTPSGYAAAQKITRIDMPATHCAETAPFLNAKPTPAESAIASKRLNEDSLIRLSRRKDRSGRAYLEPAEVEAGAKYRRDVGISQILPNVTTNWDFSGVSGGACPDRLNLAESALAARRRLADADRAVGQSLAGVLMDVCGFQKGLETIEAERQWPARSAKLILRIALERLAAHYGLSNSAQGPIRAPTRAWRQEQTLVV